MSTRAFIDLEGDNFECFRLYSPYDSYVSGGLGEALYNFIKSQTSCIRVSFYIKNSKYIYILFPYIFFYLR